MKQFFVPILLIGMLLPLTACDLGKNYTKIDRTGHKEFQDYRDAFAPRDIDIDEDGVNDAEGIPSLMPYMSPLSSNLKPMPLVSISINQSVPLRDALFELANQADYDIELDPNIRGSIIFTARERPFDMVIERISDIAGLRYTFEDDILRIELDTPYIKNYKIDYINIIRSSSSSISNNISVVSGEGADTGSSFSADTTTENDFWEELNATMAQIVGIRPQPLLSGEDPRINVASPRPAPIVQTEPAFDQNGNPIQPQPPTPPEPPQAVLEVGSLPVSDGGGRNRSGAADDEVEASYSINRQAGIISVFSTHKTHEKVQEYLTLLKRSVTAQVLIEAKVLEVRLTDEFSQGIDWSFVDPLNGEGVFNFASGQIATLGVGGPPILEGDTFVDAFGNTVFAPVGDIISAGTTRPSLNPAPVPDTNFQVGFFGNDFQALIENVSRFGIVKALASPRLTVLNNQVAALNVADNLVYFEIDIDSNTTEGGGTEVDIESEIQNVPEGVLINVQPSINLDEGVVTMSLRPTITRVVNFVADPGVAFAAGQGNIGGLESLIPVVNVQEIDTIINLRSGESIVMGGLMQDRTESEQIGAPGLSEVPLLGALFRNQGDEITKSELVIFLKATIIEGSNIHDTDKDFYRMFSDDRRPWKM